MLVPALALCACSGTSRNETKSKVAPVAPTTTVPRATSTTTQPPATPYSFDDSVPPPPLINTGTDYIAITRSLIAYDAWLLSHHPDLRLAENVTPQGTNPYKSLAHDLPILRD